MVYGRRCPGALKFPHLCAIAHITVLWFHVNPRPKALTAVPASRLAEALAATPRRVVCQSPTVIATSVPRRREALWRCRPRRTSPVCSAPVAEPLRRPRGRPRVVRPSLQAAACDTSDHAACAASYVTPNRVRIATNQRRAALGLGLTPSANLRSAANRSSKATLPGPKARCVAAHRPKSRRVGQRRLCSAAPPSRPIARKRAIDRFETGTSPDAPKSAFGFTQVPRDHRSTCRHVYGPGRVGPPLAQLGVAQARHLAHVSPHRRPASWNGPRAHVSERPKAKARCGRPPPEGDGFPVHAPALNRGRGPAEAVLRRGRSDTRPSVSGLAR